LETEVKKLNSSELVNRVKDEREKKEKIRPSLQKETDA